MLSAVVDQTDKFSKFCVEYVTHADTDGSYVLASPIWQVVEQANT
jgi:hypothetical protein